MAKCESCGSVGPDFSSATEVQTYDAQMAEVLSQTEKMQQQALALSLRQVEALESIAKSLKNIDQEGVSTY